LSSLAALAARLERCRNDLEAPAIAIEPVIGEALASLRKLPGLSIARMSGSGATCFGLFDDLAAAREAAARLQATYPSWWVALAPMLTRAGDSRP
jgi:4-diphosphocytidyl-2-C-methyl-D-erythritol kinase